MPNADRQWALSNPGPLALLLWLEPWAEEFDVPARSTVMLRSPGEADEPIGEVEWTPDHLVIWASGPTVEVLIDGKRQAGGSASIPIPEGLTRKILNIAFAGQPAARLGGATNEGSARISWWQRLRGRLGL
jgi:hypothetical protein